MHSSSLKSASWRAVRVSRYVNKSLFTVRKCRFKDLLNNSIIFVVLISLWATAAVWHWRLALRDHIYAEPTIKLAIFKQAERQSKIEENQNPILTETGFGSAAEQRASVIKGLNGTFSVGNTANWLLLFQVKQAAGEGLADLILNEFALKLLDIHSASVGNARLIQIRM